jgi:hypothetical protein
MDAFVTESRDLSGKIVTHEVEFRAVVCFGGMDGSFGGRQRENQPSVAGVDGRESENIAQKSTISGRICAV